MPLLSVGVSYRRAPVELLERLAFPTEDLPKAYHHLTSTDGVHGGVILSTCNRVEVLAEVESYHAGFQALRGFLSRTWPRRSPPSTRRRPSGTCSTSRRGSIPWSWASPRSSRRSARPSATPTLKAPSRPCWRRSPGAPSVRDAGPAGRPASAP